MTTDQFRALETFSGSGQPNLHKADDLISAAVTAFSSLTRPGRDEVQQLIDLALPLLNSATPRAKRAASAVLAQNDHAPKKLVLALCDDAIEIAAPLLLRSPLLNTLDLMQLIEKHGVAHARIVARRDTVDPLLIPLLQSFQDPVIDQTLCSEGNLDLPETTEQVQGANPAPSVQTAPYLPAISAPAMAEPHELATTILQSLSQPNLADFLLDKALLIDSGLFRNALADALDISDQSAAIIIGTWPDSQLPLALKAIGLSAQDAYLILTAVLGTIHGDRAHLREFVYIYRAISPKTAQNAVKRWRADDVNEKLRDKLREMAFEPQQDRDTPANSDGDFIRRTAL